MAQSLENFQPAVTLLAALEAQKDYFDEQQKNLLEEVKKSIKISNFEEFKASVAKISEVLPENLKADAFVEAEQLINTLETEIDLTRLQAQLAKEQVHESYTERSENKQKEKKDADKWGRLKKSISRVKKNPLAGLVGGTIGVGAIRKMGSRLLGLKGKKKNKPANRSRRAKTKEFAKTTVQNAIAATLGFLGLKALLNNDKEEKENNNGGDGEPEKRTQESTRNDIIDKGGDIVKGAFDWTGLVTPDPEPVSDEELFANTAYDPVVMLEEGNKMRMIGDNGAMNVFSQDELLNEAIELSLRQNLSPANYHGLSLTVTLQKLRSEQAKKTAETANRLTTSSSEKKLLTGNQKKVAGLINLLSFKLGDGTYPTPESKNAAAQETIKQVKEIILKTENEKTVIGHGDMNKAFSHITALYKTLAQTEGDEEETKKIADHYRFKMLHEMRGVWLGSGNSSGIQKLLTDELISEEVSYAGIAEMLETESDLATLVNGAKTYDNDAVATLLHDKTKLPKGTCKDIAKELIKDYKQIETLHTKQKELFTEMIQDQYRKPEDKNDTAMQQRLLTEYNAEYQANETNFSTALLAIRERALEDAILGSFLTKVKRRTTFNLLESRNDENKTESEHLLSSVMGVGRQRSDTSTQTIADAGVEIGLSLIPMGAGLLAARVVTGAIIKGTRLVQIGNRVSKSQKLAKLGKFTGIGAQATIEGIAFYETQNVVHNYMNYQEDVFQGRDDKSAVIQSIAMMGIGNNIKGILGSIKNVAKKYKINTIVPSGIVPLKAIRDIVAEAGIFAGGMGTVSYLTNPGEGFTEHFTWSELFMSFGMVALFHKKNSAIKKDIVVAKQHGKIVLGIKNMQKELGLRMKNTEKGLLQTNVLPKMHNLLSTMKDGVVTTFYNTKISARTTSSGKIFTVDYIPVKTLKKQQVDSMHPGTKIHNGNFSIEKTGTNTFTVESLITGKTQTYTSADQFINIMNKPIQLQYKNPYDLLHGVIPRHTKIQGKQGVSYAQGVQQLMHLQAQRGVQQFRGKHTLTYKNASYKTSMDAKSRPMFTSENGSTITYGMKEWPVIAEKLEQKMFSLVNAKWQSIYGTHTMMSRPLPPGAIQGLPKSVRSSIKDSPHLIKKKGKDILLGDFLKAWDDLRYSGSASEGVINTVRFLTGKGAPMKTTGGSKNIGRINGALGAANRLIALSQIIPPFVEGDIGEGALDTLIWGMLLRGLPSKAIGWLLGVNLDIPFKEEISNTYDSGKQTYDTVKQGIDAIDSFI